MTAAVVPAQTLLAMFEAAATTAGEAETAVRKRAHAEIAAAERERAFAYRRLNLMRTLARAIGGADKEEEAVGRGLAAVRAQIGWRDDSETRTETLARLAPVVGAAFASLAPIEDREAPPPTWQERWQISRRGTSAPTVGRFGCCSSSRSRSCRLSSADARRTTEFDDWLQDMLEIEPVVDA